MACGLGLLNCGGPISFVACFCTILCIHLQMHGQIWKVCTCVLLSSVLQLLSPRKGADFAPHAPSSENYIEVSTIFRDSEIKLTGNFHSRE